MNKNERDLFNTPQLQTALNLIAVHCHEQGIRTLRFEPPTSQSPENPLPKKWSHFAQKLDCHPENPPHLVDVREAKAIRDGLEQARQWSLQNNFVPPLHEELPHNVGSRVVHHEECTFMSGDRGFCDCGYLVVLKFANRTFAIGKGSQLEPFSCPPATIGDLEDGTLPPFVFDDDEALILRLQMYGGKPTSIVTIGEGRSARLHGDPGDDSIQDTLDKQSQRRK